MKLARVIHFDESDTLVFTRPAQTGEWAISGGFEFSNWTEADLSGKARQAFANGWLGVGTTFGRATFVAVAQIETDELEELETRLAQHFVDLYGAPDVETARPVAQDEIRHMVELCNEQDANTLLAVSRELTEAGVNEAYRAIEPQEAVLDQVAVHASYDDE